jgi:ribosomal protein S17E
MELGYEIKYDFCIRKSDNRRSKEETITFLMDERVYKKRENDWYMIVAIEKADKVKKDRHLLTGKLIIAYKHAIRVAYNHNLDKSLAQKWWHPSNKDTISGIQGYIDQIKQKMEAQEKQFEDELL